MTGHRRTIQTTARVLPSLCALLAFAVLPAGRAMAWGNDGHKIVCAIADKLLPAKHQQEVKRLVRLYRPGNVGEPYSYLSTACVFADRARTNARSYAEAKKNGNAVKAEELKGWSRFGKYSDWHFLNVSRASHDATAGDCHDDCVLKGIEEHRKRLADSTLADWKRAEALLLLGHWVGDIHQPLHVSYEDDLGGNKIDEIEGDYYNSPHLHSVWDSGIITKSHGSGDWWTYAGTLKDGIATSDRSTWEQSAPLDWANESYDITTKPEVEYCEWAAAECRSEGDTRTLDASYQAQFQPVVELRLQKAGVRLAKLIREALDEAD